ncbi:putative 3-methyladenine DNA glycosylase isoform X1 [Clytia hemisphaerica]|uniref:DNA-3-methyladenine glycosylase n=1 Tax=Clytia hemisphaerica TaxID=252671 RepID=A0A7M5X3F1_9CNID
MRRSKRNIQQDLTIESTRDESQILDGNHRNEGENVIKSKYFKTDEEKPSCSSPTVSQTRNTVCKTNIALKRTDFEKDGLQQAKYLLGKIINVCHEGSFMRGRIVETEAYLGVNDKACHAYGEKRTERTEAMYMTEGTSYVYSIYGMYNCLNISSSSYGGATLIRALEPLEGIEKMRKNREKSKKTVGKTVKTKDICNGPSKLCQAMGITKQEFNRVDMVENNDFFVSDDGWKTEEVVVCKRIGVEGYGEDAANKPYRFYVKGNANVSVINKKAEQEMTT